MRHSTTDIDDHFRRGAPAHLRRNRRRIQQHFALEHGIGVANQGAPVCFRLIPQRALRCKRPPAQKVHRRVIDRDQSGARTRLNRHVAHRHPPFHGQRPYRTAGKFQRVARAARCADGADDRQHQILGEHAGGHFAFDADTHRLRLFLRQTLRGEDVFHFARADAEGQRGERAMRGGMRIAADQRHTGQGQPLFRPDHMDNPLSLVEAVK